MKQKITKLYQSPLQGFTDFTFRNTFSDVFGGIDKYFIPYLSYGKGMEIKKSLIREILPENNSATPVVPQVLFSNQTELVDLVSILIDYGYTEINLNLGCPYPMATNKGRGASWLSRPMELEKALEGLFTKGFQANFSIKLRAGMTDRTEVFPILKCLEQFDLKEIIFHPRTADQMYEGKADPVLFAEALTHTRHPLVYNGDLFSESGFEEISKLLPEQTSWMIGRGLLMDPTLAGQLKGEITDEKQRKQKLKEFHDRLLEDYAGRLQGSGHLLMKMTQFWTYFSFSFDNQHKALKLVKKSGSLLKYNAAVAEIFRW